MKRKKEASKRQEPLATWKGILYCVQNIERYRYELTLEQMINEILKDESKI